MIPDWFGQHVAAVVVTCLTVGPVAFSLGRLDRRERRLYRLFRQFGVHRRAAGWGEHEAVMDRCDTTRRMAADVMEPGRVIAVAKVPMVEEEPTGGMQLAGSDLPARGTRLPDLADTGVFVAAEVRGMEALAYHGDEKPDPGYGPPPRIETEPRVVQPGGRYPWPSLMSAAVLEHVEADAGRQVAKVLTAPAVEAPTEDPQPDPKRRDDDPDPPAPPVLTRSVTATTIRRASHWPPARVLCNISDRWRAVVDNRPGWATPEGLRFLRQANRRPTSHAGVGYALQPVNYAPRHVTATSVMVVGGARRCVP